MLSAYKHLRQALSAVEKEHFSYRGGLYLCEGPVTAPNRQRRAVP